MKWMRFSRLFWLFLALGLLAPRSFCESLGNWESVIEDLNQVKELDPVLATDLATRLQAILGSYDQAIADRDRRLTEYDKAYVKVNKDLKISYVLCGATGALAVGAVVWALVEHLSPK